jgi:hypothetical protein
MIVCLSCPPDDTGYRVMVPLNDTSVATKKSRKAKKRAWIKQTKKEHPCTIVRCPRCGTVVADVNRGIAREEPWPGDLALDLPHDLELL